MVMVRRVLLTVVSIGVAACSSSHAQPPTGTVVGGIRSVPPGGGSLKSEYYGGLVEVLDGGRVVARMRLRAPAPLTYRFHLPPGEYRLRGTVGDQKLRICGGRFGIRSRRVTRVDTTCPIP